MASLRPARIIRSHRRTISLEITPDAALVVRAPLRASEAWILKLVEEKRAWIEKKMAETQNRPSPGERRFVPGEQFLFLGNSCTLEVLEGSDAGIMLGDRLYIGDRRLPECRALLVAWYAQKAAEILPARVPALPPFSITCQKRSGSRMPGGAGPHAVRPGPSHFPGVLSLPHPR